ncbi:putative iron-regulated transporter [Cryphonectria parasitica EP155]|uniref:Solute carrier family 40 member n=1 Tax=Cryphonectria parasitica (strain ATCC 38755 / EP155) TaxID=660469 RepID=A0A9P4XZX8_CRYP1|nr:putative iron-regulated transporter [Cryphonectria parasitica EP155]KAF3763979.1 putative iron-regulated transporter [Cryphonectria parasitica EP155]
MVQDENLTAQHTAEVARLGGSRQHMPHAPIGDADATADLSDGVGAGVPRSVAFRLYTSHFLSTWNSRLFEFGAALFLTSVFPGTLLPVSIYSLVRNAGYIALSQPLGTWINKGNRLIVIRTSIVGQRIPVAVSCALLLILERGKDGAGYQKHAGLFGAIVLLAVVEKLCSTMNTISVERDWVVVITEGNEAARRSMNARMRRIDLFCKLVGPLTISLVAIASTEIAIYTTLGMNVASVLVETIFIEQVYKRVRGLERTRGPTAPTSEVEGGSNHGPRLAPTRTVLYKVINSVLPIESLPFYFRHPAFLPSFALSLLYFTVLSFSGQMITYLVSIGYTSWNVGVARVGSSIFEISATWAAPLLMRKIGVVRAGIWSLAWQMTCLAGALGWYFSDSNEGAGTSSLSSATGLAVGVALSRVGLWGYDLSAQNIIQDEVEDDHRGTFAAVEASFQNLFEMLSYATTVVFSRPDQFRYPVVISAVAVYIAGGLYAYFLRKRRGHLFHAPPCICLKE